MIHLIGVNHAIQDNGFKRHIIEENKTDEIRKEFQDYLINLIKEKEISYIAEESNSDLLKLLKAKSTMAKLASEILAIGYKPVEPGISERNKLGIPLHYEQYSDEEKQKIYRIREKYWLEQIHDIREDNILFICGPLHVEPFSVLLEKDLWEVNTINEYWGEKYIGT